MPAQRKNRFRQLRIFDLALAIVLVALAAAATIYVFSRVEPTPPVCVGQPLRQMPC